MELSGRVSGESPNVIATTRAQLTAAGIELTDLTDSNPTRHGLFDPAISDILASHAQQVARYDPTPRGPWPARAALAERFGGDPEDYWLTASTSEAYGWLFTILADPGDVVAIPSPGYPLIEPLARLHSLSTRAYRTFYVHPSGWELDRDSVSAISPQVMVCVNPNNPTGAYADPWIISACADHGTPLIADEVFFPFQLADSPDPASRPIRLAGNESVLTFGLDGLSKLLAAPQLKLGWIRLSGPVADRVQAARALDEIADTYLSVNSLVAVALPDLLTLADSSISRVTTRLTANLHTAEKIFCDLRVRTVYGGWMMLLDVPKIMDADKLCVALMERAGLYVHPGYFYDLPDSTLAISLLPEEEVFRESCQRLVAALTVLATEHPQQH